MFFLCFFLKILRLISNVSIELQQWMILFINIGDHCRMLANHYISFNGKNHYVVHVSNQGTRYCQGNSFNLQFISLSYFCLSSLLIPWCQPRNCASVISKSDFALCQTGEMNNWQHNLLFQRDPRYYVSIAVI